MTPRLALVHDHLQGPTGMGRVVERMARVALDGGWDVTLVAANVPPDLRRACDHRPAPAFPRLPALPQHVAWCALAARALHRVRADIVHVHSPVLLASADLMTCHHLAGPAAERGVREDRTGLSGLLRRVQTRATIRLDDALYRHRPRRAAISFVSEFLRDEFARRYGDVRGGWILAPPAPSWRPVTPAERTAARRRWRCDDGLVVGYLGGDDQRKGIRDALSLTREPGMFPLMAGIDTEGVVCKRGRAVGFVDPDDLLEACDAVVAPAVFDAAPVAVLHALSRGIPVVVTPTTGWAPAIGRHGAGVVWDRSGSLSDAVRRAATLPQASLEPLVREFGADAFGRELLEVYDTLAERPTRADLG